MKRQFSIILVVVFILSIALTGCGAKTANTPASSGDAKTPVKTVDTKNMTFKEAPMLDALVKAGKLPPVKDRLPEHPFVITQEVNDIPSADMKLEIGQYGGTLRLADPSTEGGASPENWCFEKEPLVTSPGITLLDALSQGKIVGNVVESYEISSDYKVFTFHLRKGLKWSDGVPVTTEDVKFVWEDIYQNKELTPDWPGWLKPNQDPKGTPGVLDVLDDVTFKISFDQSYGLFTVYLASKWNDFHMLVEPKHYLQKFHIKYGKADEIKQLLVKEKFKAEDSWTKLFSAKRSSTAQQGGAAIDCPTLQPWVYKGQPSQGVFVFERNPYYFKVDAAGNQLPYIDKIEQTFITDLAMQTMKIVGGEVDYAVNRTNVTDFPLFKENETKGGYNVKTLKQHVTPTDIFLNLTNPDPVWRKVVQDVRFRKALNMGINRKNIIEAVQLGYGTIAGDQVPTEYNPDAAKKLLDEMGMDKKDSEGWRLGPDGKRFVIPFEIAIYTTGSDKVVELVAEYWRALGISTTMKVIDMTLAGTRQAANDLKASTLWLETSTRETWRKDPSAWYATLYGEILDIWGVAWKQWYVTQGKQGEEPPAEVKALIAEAEKVLKVTNETDRNKAMDAANKIYKDNVFRFPIATSGYPMISNKKMGNIPSNTVFGIAAAFSGEQFFFKK